MKIDISYQPQKLPPPYAYAAVFKINTNEDIHVDFQMEYLGRDELTEDEIICEGFTSNNDFQWTGNMGDRWKSILESFDHDKNKDKPDESSYIHMTIDDHVKGFPLDSKRAEMIIHELIQAIYEISEKESPLFIEFCQKDGSKEKIEWIFKERVLTINGEKSDKWEDGHQLMKSIYSLDYDTQEPLKKVQAFSINFGDIFWYPIQDKGMRIKIFDAVSTLSSGAMREPYKKHKRAKMQLSK